MTKTIKLSLLCAALSTAIVADTIKLDKVIVTSATKSEQSIKDITSNVVVINAEEIEEKNYQSVPEILKSVTGISLTTSGGIGSTTSVFLRGMGNSRTLVLIDGVRYQDPSSTSGANLSHLLASDIQRIEIIKGAQSGVWGADASAGVINIITKSATKGTHLSANVEFGSFNTKKYGSSISYANDSLELKLSANKITTDSFSVQAPRGEDVDKYEDDPYENTTINLKASYKITDDIKIKASVTNVDAIKDYDRSGADDSTMKSDVNTLLYSASYLQKAGNHNLTLKYENSKFEREEIGTTWGVKNFNGETQNIELYDNFAYIQNSFLLLGAGSSSDNVDYILANNSTNKKENKDSYVYFTNSNKLSNLILTQSLRYDKYDNFDDKTTGKLGLKYNFTNKIYLSSNIGTAYNVPNIVQELNPWGAVNDDLNPENAVSFDFTLAYNGLELTYFHQKIEDLIDWYDSDGYMGPNPAIYKNLDGESIFKGVELSYNQNISETFLLSSNYTYLIAEDKDAKELARRPKHKLNIGLDYYPMDDLHLGLYTKYVGERYNSANKQGAQTGKYTTADFTINYAYNKYLDFYTKADNISDKYYQEVDGYATAGRSFYLGLNARY